MPTPAEYEAKIQRYNWPGLRILWERIKSRDTAPEWAAGKAFEYLVLRASQLDGGEVQWPYNVPIGDEVVEQIDGAIHVSGLSFLVESKDFETDDLAIGPIAKLRDQLLRRPSGAFGVIFSRTDFTDPARLLVQHTSPQNILLWTGQEVAYALDRETISGLLVLKYRQCIELAVPDYDVRLGVTP